MAEIIPFEPDAVSTVEGKSTDLTIQIPLLFY